MNYLHSTDEPSASLNTNNSSKTAWLTNSIPVFLYYFENGMVLIWNGFDWRTEKESQNSQKLLEMDLNIAYKYQ